MGKLSITCKALLFLWNRAWNGILSEDIALFRYIECPNALDNVDSFQRRIRVQWSTGEEVDNTIWSVRCSRGRNCMRVEDWFGVEPFNSIREQ